MYNSISQVFCIASLCVCKLSICVSLLRIIRGSEMQLVRWTLYSTMVLVFTVNAAVIVTLFAQCHPVRKVWNSSIPGKCFAFPIELYLAILQGGALLNQKLHRPWCDTDSIHFSGVGIHRLATVRSSYRHIQGASYGQKKQDYSLRSDGTRRFVGGRTISCMYLRNDFMLCADKHSTGAIALVRTVQTGLSIHSNSHDSSCKNFHP